MKSQQKISNPSDDVAISIQHVTKIFKNVIGTPFKVLDDISFEVRKGDFHGFIGNNGAGKTTTIRLILNYYQNGYGKIFINGIDSKNKHAKDKIGYIPEISVFPKNLTIYEYLYYFAKLSKLSNIEAKNKIDQLLSKYGFNVKIVELEFATWLQEVYTNRDFEMTLIGLSGKLDPDAILRRYTSKYKRNFIGFNNEEYDKLILDAKRTVDVNKRVELYKKAQQILVDESSSVYLMDPTFIVAHSKDITGYTKYPIAYMNFAKLKFSE